jgi:hypothetical protein
LLGLLRAVVIWVTSHFIVHWSALCASPAPRAPDVEVPLHVASAAACSYGRKVWVHESPCCANQGSASDAMGLRGSCDAVRMMPGPVGRLPRAATAVGAFQIAQTDRGGVAAPCGAAEAAALGVPVALKRALRRDRTLVWRGLLSDRQQAGASTSTRTAHRPTTARRVPP